jgi:MOSC domain-containing protein YiiM
MGDDGEPIGRIVSVNIGRPRSMEWQGRTIRTAIWKDPVDGPVDVRGVNLAGDDQADRRVHGGEHKAVYAYASEDYAWWSGSLGIELGPGTFGDNLTTEGLDLRLAVVGERWRVGTCRLEVSEPRMPCFKLGARMGTADFVDLFDVVARHGTYLRIVEEGAVAAGDEIVLESRPDDTLTVGELAAAREGDDADLLQRVVDHPAVSPSWVNSARRALGRLGRRQTDDSD